MKLLHFRLPGLAFVALLASTPVPAATVPAGTKTISDLVYVTNGHARQKLDLYLPEKVGSPTPVIVWIHGGGWVSGDKKENGAPGSVSHTTRGFAVASINYRLSGDAIFPAQIEDCKAAIRWLRAHAKEYNLDPRYIGVAGASAGGHLAALLGATGHVKNFDVGENLDQSSAVQAVNDLFGPTDLLQMDAHALSGSRLVHDAASSPESRLVGGPIQEKPYRDRAGRANPIPYLTKSASPYLIIHGDQDPLVPHHQSELLFAALKQHGVPVRFHTIKGAGHGQGFGGKEISEMIAAFFDHHLMGKETASTWPVAMTSHSLASAIPSAQQDGAQSQRPDPRASEGRWQRPTWSQFLNRNDTNADGKVSRDEFKGPPQIFEMLDRNKDGIIVKEEHEPTRRN
ncbi:MAG: alpha/beta hydrolase fold domain-containing protein [Opitutaceae bacterium]|nr:alpha/beta hydrolase fold domain-containing protein [Opitutaceae bacterium]